MVATSTSAPPIAPKRGMILVALLAPKDEVLASGLIIPRELVENVKRARIVQLGAEPIDFRTGIERPWDYTVGQVLALRQDIPASALPYEWQGEPLALITDAHIAGLWVGEP